MKRVSVLGVGKHTIRTNSEVSAVTMTPMPTWYRGRAEVAEPLLDQVPFRC